MNRPIIVTGCQRSGTTLLSLILDSHPQIRSVDEAEFDLPKLGEYLGNPAYHPNVAFKLPKDAAFFHAFKTLPDLKVLWCVRDPRDVVLSMLNLAVDTVNGKRIAWANHSHSGMREIESCFPFLPGQEPPPGMQEYQRVSRLPLHMRSRRDGVTMGALCWELKNRLPDLYARESFPHMVVVYEELIRRPRATLEKVLAFLGLPWHDDVLNHHKLHNQLYIGNTPGNKPIDPENSGKWRRALDEEELEIIESVCHGSAARFGYDLGVEAQLMCA